MRSKRTLIGRIKDFLRERIGHFMFARAFGLTLINNPDLTIPENCEISINGENWRIFPSPGHASDHISLYNEKKGVLFSGDNVLRTITTWLGPPDSDLEDYIKSIEEISNLKNIQLILGAHGSPITNPTERLAEILEHRKERLKQIENLIVDSSENGITPSEIVEHLYPGEGMWKHSIARGYVVLTLEYLEKLEKISRKLEKKGIIRFYPTYSK